MITFKHVYTNDEYEDTVVNEDLLNEAPQQNMQQQVADPNVGKAKAVEFFARVRAAATAMHFFHLITPSYAQHVASQTFYDEIIDLVDTFCETFIGRYGKFEVMPNVKEPATDGLQIVGNLTKWVDANRMAISDLSEIQNEIDNIVNLCNSTAYKLRELK